MSCSFGGIRIAGLALGLTASLTLLSPDLGAQNLPHTTLTAADGSARLQPVSRANSARCQPVPDA